MKKLCKFVIFLLFAICCWADIYGSKLDSSLKVLSLEKSREIRMLSHTGRNLTGIEWAHGVNSRELLIMALNDIDIDMIEADIVLGLHNGKGKIIPIMAHPPSTVSNLTLADFLQEIQAHNEDRGEAAKGIKLDFKSIDVFESSLSILDNKIPEFQQQVWLNADIVSGPVDENNIPPVDPARFFAGCMRYKQAVLSVGWTTQWGPTCREGGYTAVQVGRMCDVLRANNVLATGQSITFPLRAGIAANSGDTVQNLISTVNETNDVTLTIWSSVGDYIDIAKLRGVIYSVGMDRIYLDVPREVRDQLNLRQNLESATVGSLLNFGMVSLLFWVFTTWLKSI